MQPRVLVGVSVLCDTAPAKEAGVVEAKKYPCSSKHMPIAAQQRNSAAANSSTVAATASDSSVHVKQDPPTQTNAAFICAVLLDSSD